MNHGVLYGDSFCESWCVILSQWLLVMVCFDVPVVVSHGELCCARGLNHGVIY